MKGEYFLNLVQALRKELVETKSRLGEANAIIANTAATVQAFRMLIPPANIHAKKQQN